MACLNPEILLDLYIECRKSNDDPLTGQKFVLASKESLNLHFSALKKVSEVVFRDNDIKHKFAFIPNFSFPLLNIGKSLELLLLGRHVQHLTIDGDSFDGLNPDNISFFKGLGENNVLKYFECNDSVIAHSFMDNILHSKCFPILKCFVLNIKWAFLIKNTMDLIPFQTESAHFRFRINDSVTFNRTVGFLTTSNIVNKRFNTVVSKLSFDFNIKCFDVLLISNLVLKLKTMFLKCNQIYFTFNIVDVDMFDNIDEIPALILPWREQIEAQLHECPSEMAVDVKFVTYKEIMLIQYRMKQLGITDIPNTAEDLNNLIVVENPDEHAIHQLEIILGVRRQLRRTFNYEALNDTAPETGSNKHIIFEDGEI